jgi:predicted Co/Zn/Cd cation transporter (cation efflux family)
VFGIRASKGYKPAYVGKATKTFKQEVFSHHKLTRYQQYLADVGKGTPVIFFVIAPKRRGAPNSRHIGQLEDFLIQAGVAANPAFLNVRGTKVEEWGIAGVLRSGKGKRSESASELIKLMKIVE